MQTETIQSTVSLIIQDISVNRLELSRLMAAAVVNQQFCHLLLEDPEQAIDKGYQGERFNFTKQERDLISSIRADSLADLANKLMCTLNEQHHYSLKRPVQLAANFGY
jgi:hypothetical protein